MKLLVSYGVVQRNIEDRIRVRLEHVIVEAPENLLVIEFKDYVNREYFKRLVDMEQDCCGSEEYVGLSINDVEYIVEMSNGLCKE